MTRDGRKSEGGYALLLVYAMAASVAVMLYLQVPRAAFEAQRDKEQLLIDRGEQYTRAVQLYVRKYNRFPVDMQALENTQSLRFLRRQYTDPMTGKSEWRLIHVGPGGVFLDSLVHKQKKDANAPQTFITELQQIGGGGAAPGGEGVNLATRRRPSDAGGAGDTFPTGGGSVPGAQSPGAQPSGAQPPINGPVMVLPDGRIVPATSNGQIAQTPTGAPGQPGQPGQGFPPGTPMPSGMGIQAGGQPGIGGQPVNGLPPGFQNQPNGAPGAPPQSAANLINQILTTPRPGGLNGVQEGQGQGGGFGQPIQQAASGTLGTPIQGATGGQTIGGGIAGVASKMEREGIKIFGERTAYNEWEFVYDMSKDPMRGGGRGGVQPQPINGQPGTSQGTSQGTTSGSVPSFGQPGSNTGNVSGSTPQR